MERAEGLINAGVDVLVVDSAHGHSEGVLEQIRQIKSHYKDIQIIGGNIATAEGALALVKAGVDAVKVGIGPWFNMHDSNSHRGRSSANYSHSGRVRSPEK